MHARPSGHRRPLRSTIRAMQTPPPLVRGGRPNQPDLPSGLWQMTPQARLRHRPTSSPLSPSRPSPGGRATSLSQGARSSVAWSSSGPSRRHHVAAIPPRRPPERLPRRYSMAGCRTLPVRGRRPPRWDSRPGGSPRAGSRDGSLQDMDPAAYYSRPSHRLSAHSLLIHWRGRLKAYTLDRSN